MAEVTRVSGPGRKALETAIAQLEGREGQVGWFSSSKYPDGTPVAYVAAIQEFGYAPKNIPPRMGLRQMVADKQREWAQKVAALAKLVISNEGSADDMLTGIGAVAEGDIRKQIASVTSPPLAPATIEARRRRSASGEARTATGAKPLVDTGYMLATVTHLVANEGNNGDGEKITGA